MTGHKGTGWGGKGTLLLRRSAHILGTGGLSYPSSEPGKLKTVSWRPLRRRKAARVGCEACRHSLCHSQGTAACSGDHWMSGRLHGAIPQGQGPLLVSSTLGPQPELNCLLNE